MPVLNADNPTLPHPVTTPGSLDPDATRHFKASGRRWPTPRRVTHATKNAVFTAYGIQPTDRADMEIDHLVPLSLGGSNWPSNLWPQPEGGQWTGDMKDRLEVVMLRLVDDGHVALPAAQAMFATNWQTAYRQFILGDPAAALDWPQPLPAVADAANEYLDVIG